MTRCQMSKVYERRLKTAEKLQTIYGDKPFTSQEAARHVGFDEQYKQASRFFNSLVEAGVLYSGRVYLSSKKYRVLYCCAPIEDEQPEVVQKVAKIKKKSKTEERIEQLKERFEYEPFSIREASEELGLSIKQVEFVILTLRERKLVRSEYVADGNRRRAQYRFLTDEQLTSGDDFDFREFDEPDPTNGVFKEEIQLFGDALARYEEIHAQKMSDPYNPRFGGYGRILTKSTPLRAR